VVLLWLLLLLLLRQRLLQVQKPVCLPQASCLPA
jgi:hypothetical protein